MLKQTAKNSSPKERLGTSDADLKHGKEMQSFEELVEKFVPFIEVVKKAHELLEGVKESSKTEGSHFMYVPSKPLTYRDLEDALASKKQRKSNNDPIIFVFERKTHTLFKKEQPEKCCSFARSPLREEILRVIRLDFQKTKDLAQDLNSTEKSIRSTIDKINRKAMNDLSLAEKLIVGEENAGYRLNPLYSLIKK